MQNTTQEFKVGDKFIVTKKSFRDQGYTEVYTVSKTDSFRVIQFLNHNNEEALVYTNEIEHYLPEPEPEKHIHHDLIVAWAKDPKGCIIQWYDPLVKWVSCNENKPSWSDELTYRIKPKTKEVTRWKWVVKSMVGDYFVTDAEYTEEEAKKTFKHFTGIKIPDSAVTTIEEV